MNDEVNVNNENNRIRANAREVAQNLIKYFRSLEHFKKINNLKEIDDMFEVCTSLSDKHGRICRHLKHIKRDDPKDNWSNEVIESLQGYLTYFAMIVSKFNLLNTMEDHIIDEIMKSVQQHSKKDDDRL